MWIISATKERSRWTVQWHKKPMKHAAPASGNAAADPHPTTADADAAPLISSARRKAAVTTASVGVMRIRSASAEKMPAAVMIPGAALFAANRKMWIKKY